MCVSLIILECVSGLKTYLAGFRVQVLDLQEHHPLLTLRLGPQLLHLNVDVAVDLLEQQHILGVEIGWLLHGFETRLMNLWSLTKWTFHFHARRGSAL